MIYAVIVYGFWTFCAVLYVWAVCYAAKDLLKRWRRR